MMKILNFKSVTFVKISKYKTTMQNNKKAIGYVPNWTEKGFATKKVKNIVPRRYVISGENKGKDILGTFYKEELQKTNQK